MNKVKNIEYAIVDIETTGGNARGSRMTEIAIAIHNGTEVIDRWESLINPERDIPLAIFALTGIDNDVVADAPVFGDIAQQVFDMLEGRIFVAHNVNFDYSFIRHQLEEEGYKWTARKLCTVRLSRKIKPGLRSYSLGKLCDSLAIPISNRHRAGGDTDATTILFSYLLQWDTEGVMEEMLKKTSTDQRFPPNLAPEDFEALPDTPGVYYFMNQQGNVIYVGKAVNLKKRVASHFTGHNINKQRQHFLKEIYHITFEICATELMALLLECTEIKRLWPIHNRALKRFEPKFGLFKYEAMNGYQYLAVGKLHKHSHCIQVFNLENEGIHVLRQLMLAFELDHRMCRFGASAIPYGSIANKDQVDLPEINEHNTKVDRAIDYLLEQQPTFMIMDKGRTVEEKSYIWVEKGNFYAMGYLDQYAQVTSMDDIRSSLKRYYGNHYMMQLIKAYISKYPYKVTHLHDTQDVLILPEPNQENEYLLLF
ncbi:GIY-YIG nuclease family protein [Sphingobacterium sp. SRCM116780]|uniref:exonuclease domain-containing protein n=1 Tax=Sphingobacterium sp. SRCM116780 TaxID=2907623 RepID=UPI001F43EB89|nr:exonuclease domain-containing protein [Sphingobacterium sp. SRCM116780]UIR57426.1 GIY-YIG nuclease family protein [Sphingobacterium sp. SRCM116780]